VQTCGLLSFAIGFDRFAGLAVQVARYSYR
jgi:hypothetical protein